MRPMHEEGSAGLGQKERLIRADAKRRNECEYRHTPLFLKLKKTQLNKINYC